MPSGLPASTPPLDAHGFHADIERYVRREEADRYRHRLRITALAGAGLFLAYCLLDVQIGYGKLPAWQLGSFAAVRLTGAVGLIGLGLLMTRRRFGMRALKLADFCLFTLAGLACVFIIAGMWDVVPDYYVGLGQIMIVRCMWLPGGAKRAVPVCATLVLALPVGLLMFHSFDPAVLTGESGQRVMVACSGLAGFMVIGLIGSATYHQALTAALRAEQQGRYTIETLIDQGGMGVVYRAWDRRLERPCALKVIAASKRPDGEEIRRRIEQEARATSQLRGSHVIEIYDYGETAGGDLYYTMELLEGMTVKQLVERAGPLPPSRVIHLGRQICRGLSTAHRRRLIHRDIKPANVFVTSTEEDPDLVKILDFGLVKVVAGAGETGWPGGAARSTHSRDTDASGGGADTATRAGAMLGTPAYMAPEQIRGELADIQSDIYGLGGVLYYMATGASPYLGGSESGLLMRKLQLDPDPPSSRLDGIPRDLEDVVMRCLQRSAMDRFPTADGVGEALEACADGADWSERTAGEFWETVEDLPAPPAPSAAQKTSSTTVVPPDGGGVDTTNSTAIWPPSEDAEGG